MTQKDKVLNLFGFLMELLQEPTPVISAPKSIINNPSESNNIEKTNSPIGSLGVDVDRTKEIIRKVETNDFSGGHIPEGTIMTPEIMKQILDDKRMDEENNIPIDNPEQESNTTQTT